MHKQKVVFITTYLKNSRVKSYSKLSYCSKKYFVSAKPTFQDNYCSYDSY